jgi:hypothetical protein
MRRCRVRTQMLERKGLLLEMRGFLFSLDVGFAFFPSPC